MTLPADGGTTQVDGVGCLFIFVFVGLQDVNQDFDRAGRTLRQIIAQYPLEIEAYTRLAMLPNPATSLEEKTSIFKQALAIDPAAYDIWNLLGFAYCHRGRYEEAFAAFKRYIELAPNEANAYDSLGMCYNEAGRFDEALGEFKRALELNPRFHLTYPRRRFLSSSGPLS